MNLRALIADDEPPARFRVRELLTDAGDVEILGEAGNGRDTLSLLRQHRPELLLLDVQMPAPTGVELLRELPPEQRPCTIFVTAYENHALPAFDLRAVDYLLKPFSAERFHEALGRAREAVARSAGRGRWLRRLLVREGTTSTVIPVEQIAYLESDNNYVIVHAFNKRFMLRRTLGGFADNLDPAQFIRTGRAHIVNLQSVRAIEAVIDAHSVILHNGVRLPLTIGVREIQSRLERGVS